MLSFAAVLFAAVFIAYLPAIGGDFIWDDDAYVTANTTLAAPDALFRIWFEPGATIQYYPLVFTSFWLERLLWGLHPAGYHLVNVLLHAFAAILLWRVLDRLEIPGAKWAAAVFALHPVNVESVAWITERKNVLSILFYLLALRACWKCLFPDPSPGAGAKANPAAWLAALALFACALLSKTSTVAFPIVILLLVWWKKGVVRPRQALAMLPFFALAVAAGLMTSHVEKHTVGAADLDWSLTFLQRALLAGRALCFYFTKIFLPIDLCFIYHRWTIDPAQVAQWVYPILVAAALAVAWLLRSRWGRGPITAFLYFIITLGPILGFVNFFFMNYSFVADHFQYLAAIGPITLACAVAASRSPASPSSAARGIPIAIVILLGALTFQRAGVFRNKVSLWTDVLAKSPSAQAMAHENLAVHFSDTGRPADALPHFEAALRIKPAAVETRLNYAVTLQALGRPDDAIRELRDVLQRQPSHFIAATNLGLFLADKGQTDEAAQCYERAIRARPDFATAHFNYARLLAKLGRTADAAAHYREAIRLDPADAEAARELEQLGSKPPGPIPRPPPGR